MKQFLTIIILMTTFSSCKNNDEKKINPVIVNENSLPKFVIELLKRSSTDSGNVALKVNLVDVLDSLGNRKMALQEVDKLISGDSLNNTYWLKRGKLCKMLEDTPSAIKAFHYATKIYTSPIALMELANLYAETKNVKTISICKQLRSMNPDGSYDAQANFFVGVYFSKMNDIVNAIKHFNLSIEKDFHFDDAYIEKGYLLYNNKKFEQALSVFKQLVAVNQTSADGYYWLAKSFEALNKFEDAVINYNKALIFNANLIEAKQAIERLNLNKR